LKTGSLIVDSIKQVSHEPPIDSLCFAQGRLGHGVNGSTTKDTKVHKGIQSVFLIVLLGRVYILLGLRLTALQSFFQRSFSLRRAFSSCCRER